MIFVTFAFLKRPPQHQERISVITTQMNNADKTNNKYR